MDKASSSDESGGGSPFGESGGELIGKWVLQLETLPGDGEMHGEYHEVIADFVETVVGDDEEEVEVELHIDVDGDFSFDDGAVLPCTVVNDSFIIDSSYTYMGEDAMGEEVEMTVGVMAVITEMSYGSRAGSWTEERTDPETGVVVTTPYNMVGVRFINPPSANVGGYWSVLLRVDYTSDGLGHLVGTQENIGWGIKQEYDGPYKGLLRIDDDNGNEFLGMVNDTVVTFARRHYTAAGLTTYKTSAISPWAGWFQGNIEALVNDDSLDPLEEHMLGYYFNASPGMGHEGPFGETSPLSMNEQEELNHEGPVAQGVGILSSLGDGAVPGGPLPPAGSSVEDSDSSAAPTPRAEPTFEPEANAFGGNPLGWWPGDGEACDIAGANPGAMRGNAGFATGLVDQAFMIPDSAAWVEVADSPDLHITGDLTIEAWVRLSALDFENGGRRPRMIVDHGAGDLRAYSFWIMGDQGKSGLAELRFGHGDADTVHSDTLGWVEETWYHVAVVRRQDNGVTFYRDGVQVGSGMLSMPAQFFPGEALALGGSSHEFGGFRGQIDEIGLYGRPLSQDELRSIHEAGNTGKAKTPILSGPAPGVVGAANSLLFAGATPGGIVGVGFSLNTGSTAVGPICPGLSVDLQSPKVVGTAIADGCGNANVSGYAPVSLLGTTVYLQGLDVSACEVSNVATHTFL